MQPIWPISLPRIQQGVASGYRLQFGDAALFITDHKGGETIADLAEEISVSMLLIAASALDVTPDLAVLAAPDDLARARQVKARHVDLLLRLVRHH